MGEAFNTEEIFELKDKWGASLNLHLISDEHSKQRMLVVEDSEHGEFEVTKPLARKIVKELIEEFKLEDVSPPNHKWIGYPKHRYFMENAQEIIDTCEKVYPPFTQKDWKELKAKVEKE